MVLALIVFTRLYLSTHRPGAKGPGQPSSQGPGMAVEVESPGSPRKAPSPVGAPGSTASAPGGTVSPACNVLDRALDGVVRNPEDGPALAEAQRQLEACPTPPVRACELGAALDARAPTGIGLPPARALLAKLCQRCRAEANPCAANAARAIQESAMGHAPEPGEALWNLEHAGPDTRSACASLVRMSLVPAATTGEGLNAKLSPLGAALVPPCVRAGQVPEAVLSALVVQQGARADGLAGLVKAPAGAASAQEPQQITGAEAGSHAFDGNEKSGVDVGNGRTPRWEADGALRGQFEPPLKQLTSLRVRAKGAGTLRAIVRLPPGLGLEDRERGTFFVNPTVCQFKGTGQWETCTLKVPLLDVEALSVFPAQPKISLYEVEAHGTR